MPELCDNDKNVRQSSPDCYLPYQLIDFIQQKDWIPDIHSFKSLDNSALDAKNQLEVLQCITCKR